MADLNKTTGFWNVGNETGEQVSLADTEFGAKFKDFVAEVTLLLVFGVKLLELSGWVAEDLRPATDYGVSGTEHKSAFLVTIDNSSEE